MNEKIYKTMSRTGACSIAVDDRQWKQTAEKKV